MLKNTSLIASKKVKNDEFYTKKIDVDKELLHYADLFVGKTIYCNCDDPVMSNFVRWFYMRFHTLHLKRIIVTAYNSDTYNGGGDYWDTNFATVDPKAIDIGKEISKDVRKLNGNGDFQSDECIELLKQADIVVTNPPFSLFREFIQLMMDNNKHFVVLGNLNAITYNDIFKHIKENKIRLGYVNGHKWFMTPEGKEVRLGNTAWYTTLPIIKYNEEILLFRKYSPELYPKYDNYDAINVDKTYDIPCDYDGIMGVPISFLNKYNPTQFEIIQFKKGNDNKDLSYNEKTPYFRILIKKKK